MCATLAAISERVAVRERGCCWPTAPALCTVEQLQQLEESGYTFCTTQNTHKYLEQDIYFLPFICNISRQNICKWVSTSCLCHRLHLVLTPSLSGFSASAGRFKDNTGGTGRAFLPHTHSAEVSAGTAGPCDPGAAGAMGPPGAGSWTQ